MEASRNKYYKTEDAYIPALSLPDNYDPRIRGSVVHDFDSAPRSARSGLHSEDGTPPKSANGLESQSNNQYVGRSHAKDEDSPSSTEKEHTPVFKEHFDDGIDLWQDGRDGPTKRPKSGFMYKVALQEPGPQPDPSSLPAFARNLPSSFPTHPEPIPRVASPPRPPLEVVLEAALSESLPKNPSIISSPPTSPPSKARSRASSNADPAFIPIGFPKRFKSDASRFSFDLAGVGSAAQEQLLEEKHRQKAKEKARAHGSAPALSQKDDLQDEDVDSIYSDDIIDDDGLEERIPGVNADADDDVPMSKPPDPNAVAYNDSAVDKTAFVSLMSPVSESLSSPGSPQYLQGRQPIGFQHPPPLADTESETSLALDRSDQAAFSSPFQTLQTDSRLFNSDSQVMESLRPLDAKLPKRPVDDYDDDMYFDDGMIEDMEVPDGPAFDETQFDDETSQVYGIPIRDLPKTEHIQGMPTVRTDDVTDNEDSPTRLFDVARDDMIADELRDSLADLNHTSRPVFSNTAGLTQDNLAAYHDALAFAANQAALNGKFMRQQSVQSQNHHYIGTNDAEESPIPVEESPSLEINGLPLLRTIPSNEDYDFDDALSDDPIIAAANAEALENDDDGFYGQEFGFFAAANGTGEYANGGFFGQGIMRSHSGRNADQALTPITERSEWSNRNSAINLALHSYSQMSLPQANPGLVQLADMMHLDDDNMSLSALMKLRRGAWGSSTTSLHSSSGTSGSPLTFLPPLPSNTTALQHQEQRNSYPPVSMQQEMGNSTHSLAKTDSSDDSSASENSRTLTLPTLPSITIPPTSPAISAPFMQDSASGSESSPAQSRPRSALPPVTKPKGHSRHGSGDRESVSYVQERVGDGVMNGHAT